MTVSFALTYDSLVTSVLEYLERSDEATAQRIPTFITLCEFEIAQQIKTLGQQQVASSSMTIANPVLPKPARWRKTVSMTLYDPTTLTRQPILLRKYEYLRNYWPNPTSTGLPLYYADYDYDNWLVAPTPDSAYVFEVLYYERLEPLSSSVQTNWITRNAPNALLYGTLLQAMPYLKNDQRQIFQQKYSEAMQALKAEDQIRLADRQTLALES
jgi:hypothetical protein